MHPVTVRFHQALEVARQFLHQHPLLGKRRLLVRDLKGRIRVFLADKPDWTKGINQQTEAARALHAPTLHAALGPWSLDAATVLQDACVFADFDAIWAHSDAVALDAATRFLDRGVTGADWLRPLLPNAPPTPPRATLFGLKGGVGRSSALAVWSRHLAEAHGKRVLVVDLDLDAPGVGSMLLPEASLPDFGVVDWFVERAVGQSDTLLGDLKANSPLVAGTGGEIYVVPAAGRRTGDYLPKLARVYQGDFRDGQELGFGDLLAKFLDALENHWNPDVVLIDSRSGLHDIAAIALTRLNALNLLFAVDTPQTWAGYRHLVAPWIERARREPDHLDPVRRRFQVVAGQVPKRDRSGYLARLRTRAYGVFSELYDADPDEGAPPPDLFAFGPDAEDAPHHALPIDWDELLTDWDPVERPDAVSPTQLRAAFGEFLDKATELLGVVP